MLCVLCHRHDVPLDVAHIVSVRDGLEQGLSDAVLYSDDNLVAMCASCNSGLSSRTIPAHRQLLLFALRSQRFRDPLS
jgi:5-methylcytosine-specific restriction endonuclease McrA